MLEVSIGIPAYNEEANIGQLLENLLGQRLKKVRIAEIIVIASGCTDRTVEIVENWQKKDRRIKLFKQTRRLGKTSADNLFLKKARSSILVLESADTLPSKNCIEKLVAPFSNPKVGITAARIVPLNKKSCLSGYFSHLWWQLFHRVALNFFRAGELLAFRKVDETIPPQIGADEVFLTDTILAQGFRAKYVGLAIANNMGPETVRDVILIRRRNACLHFQFAKMGPKVYFRRKERPKRAHFRRKKRLEGVYYPKTMDNWYILRLFLREVNWFSPKETIFGIASATLEGTARLLARYDFHIKNRNYQIWSRSKSTKRLLGLKKGKGEI